MASIPGRGRKANVNGVKRDAPNDRTDRTESNKQPPVKRSLQVETGRSHRKTSATTISSSCQRKGKHLQRRFSGNTAHRFSSSTTSPAMLAVALSVPLGTGSDWWVLMAEVAAGSVTTICDELATGTMTAVLAVSD